jgi:phospholipid transport system substrate-binding protein
MRVRGRVTLIAASLLALLALVPRAWAGEPGKQLLTRIDQVLKVLDDPQLKKPERAQERRQAVRRIAIEILDFEEISRRSLGRHWDARTARERQEFMQLFGDLLERAYIARLETYSGEQIALVGDESEGSRAIVRTKVVTRRGAEIPVEYRMLRRGKSWRAYDVVLGGMSLVDSYRAQFDKVIQRTSYRQLVQQVREK